LADGFCVVLGAVSVCTLTTCGILVVTITGGCSGGARSDGLLSGSQPDAVGSSGIHCTGQQDSVKQGSSGCPEGSWTLGASAANVGSIGGEVTLAGNGCSV
jgi:hypothetical protein